MAYCGPTQLRSQAARPNRSNHPPLRVVILVTSFDPSPTPKKKIPRLEIHGEDGDGRSRCVFWRGEAEAATELVEIGAVVSCVVQRSDCDGAVVVCEGCRDLRVEWRAGDAPHAKAVVRRVAGAARPAKRPRPAPPAGSYWSPLPLGAAVQSQKSVWTRAAISVAQPRIGRGESDQAVGRLLMMVLNGDAPLILRLRDDDGTSIDCKATPQLARALHFCLSGDDVDTCVAHAITAGQKHRRLQNGIPLIECKLSPGPVVSGIALLKEDASWTPPSAPSTSR